MQPKIVGRRQAGSRAAVLAVSFCLSIGLTACGGGGGGDDSSQIRSAITTLIQKSDCAVLTPRAQKTLTGETGGKCSHDLGLRKKPKTFRVTSVKVNGATAQARVVSDGHPVGLKLLKQDGTWRIDDIQG